MILTTKLLSKLENESSSLRQQQLNWMLNRSSTIIILLVTLLITVNGSTAKATLAKRRCDAGCSPHITLPCSFGSLDQCIEKTCRDLCWSDNYREMNACYCRGTSEGPTLRMCFCGPSVHQRKKISTFKTMKKPIFF
uniref:Defensin-like protein n=1 Tax=Syphacia muris TaxID=451379 RepID=A0A0N5AKA2_9BILA